MNWNWLGLLIPLLMVITVGPLHSEIYLRKTDSGKIKLTDHPVDDGFQLILKSKIPEDYEIPSRKELGEYVSSASEEHDIPETLIYALIRIESDGNKSAKSHRGAVGLMQLMPATAESLGVKNPYDPRQNIMGGSKYLKKMLNMFGGDLDRALAAYNAGPGRVREHGGVPPLEQTKKFVKRVRNVFQQFQRDSDLIYTYYDERGVLHVTNIH